MVFFLLQAKANPYRGNKIRNELILSAVRCVGSAICFGVEDLFHIIIILRFMVGIFPAAAVMLCPVDFRLAFDSVLQLVTDTQKLSLGSVLVVVCFVPAKQKWAEENLPERS